MARTVIHDHIAYRRSGREGLAVEETTVAPTADYPWQSAREDVQKLFNLRLPEKHLLMLRFIAEHTPDTMQKFCLKHLLPAIEEKIAELTRT